MRPHEPAPLALDQSDAAWPEVNGYIIKAMSICIYDVYNYGRLLWWEDRYSDRWLSNIALMMVTKLACLWLFVYLHGYPTCLPVIKSMMIVYMTSNINRWVSPTGDDYYHYHGYYLWYVLVAFLVPNSEIVQLQAHTGGRMHHRQP